MEKAIILLPPKLMLPLKPFFKAFSGIKWE